MAIIKYDTGELSSLASNLSTCYNSIQEALLDIIDNYNKMLSNWDSPTKDYFSGLCSDLTSNFYVVIAKMRNANDCLNTFMANYQQMEQGINITFFGSGISTISSAHLTRGGLTL